MPDLSPAIEWLENHPESPYNLEHTELRDQYTLERSRFWESPHVLWRACRPVALGSVCTAQPMFCLKPDG